MGRQLWQPVQVISGAAFCFLGLGFGLPSQSATLVSQRLIDEQLLPQHFPVFSTSQLFAAPLASPGSVVAAFPASVEPSRPINSQLLLDVFLPRYPSFDSQLLDQQIVLYSLHLLLSGPPDILIVGSSRAVQGVDPDVLQQSLVEQGYPEYEIYNFSINGATAQVIDLLLSRILTTDQLPKLVIWADGSRAFNSGRSDRTYEQITSSEGFQQIENEMHPILYRASEHKSEQCQDLPRSYSTVASQRSTIRTLPRTIALQMNPIVDPWTRLTALKNTSSAIAFNQTPLSKPCSYFLSLRREEMASAQAEEMASATSEIAGDNFPIAPDDFTSIPSFALEATGFLENLTEFDPETYYDTYPYVSGDYDANYVPFTLEGPQTEAVHRIVKHLEQQNVRLVVVNLPLTQNYLDATRRQYESIFLEHMRQSSIQRGFTFVDLNQPELAQNQHFADPSHLNATGAQVVAKQLALQSIISWPNLND